MRLKPWLVLISQQRNDYGKLHLTCNAATDIQIHFTVHAQFWLNCKALIKQHLSSSTTDENKHKLILHTNSQSTSEQLLNKVNILVDDGQHLKTDIILINNALFPEEKFMLTKIFIDTHMSQVDGLSPTILVAMAGCFEC